MLRFTLTFASFGILLLTHTPAWSQPPQQPQGMPPTFPKLKSFDEVSKTPAIIRLLKDTELDMKIFPLPMKAHEAIEIFAGAVSKDDFKLAILLDEDAFEAERIIPPLLPVNLGKKLPPNVEPIRYSDIIVRFPYGVDKMSAENLLGLLLTQFPEKNATYFIRRGQLIITTKSRAGIDRLLKETVSAHVHLKPMLEVIYLLADQTGADIVVDPRIGEKAFTPVSVTFANTTTLGSALTIVTDIAGLRYMVVGDGLYVTTPQNADRLKYLGR